MELELTELFVVIGFELLVVVLVLLIMVLFRQYKNAKKLNRILENDLEKTLKETNKALEGVNENLSKLNENDDLVKETLTLSAKMLKDISEITTKINNIALFKKNVIKKTKKQTSNVKLISSFIAKKRAKKGDNNEKKA